MIIIIITVLYVLIAVTKLIIWIKINHMNNWLLPASFPKPRLTFSFLYS